MDSRPRARAADAVAPSRQEGIALCLSGGGFRASLFHLGPFRRLHETGILQRTRAISSVSGGSIFAAFLATRLHQLGRTQGAAGWPPIGRKRLDYYRAKADTSAAIGAA